LVRVKHLGGQFIGTRKAFGWTVHWYA